MAWLSYPIKRSLSVGLLQLDSVRVGLNDVLDESPKSETRIGPAPVFLANCVNFSPNDSRDFFFPILHLKYFRAKARPLIGRPLINSTMHAFPAPGLASDGGIRTRDTRKYQNISKNNRLPAFSKYLHRSRCPLPRTPPVRASSPSPSECRHVGGQTVHPEPSSNTHPPSGCRDLAFARRIIVSSSSHSSGPPY